MNEVQLGIPFPSGPWAVMHHVALTHPRLYDLTRSGDLVSLDAAHHQFGLVDHLLPAGADLTEVRRAYVCSVRPHGIESGCCVSCVSCVSCYDE